MPACVEGVSDRLGVFPCVFILNCEIFSVSWKNEKIILPFLKYPYFIQDDE